MKKNVKILICSLLLIFLFGCSDNKDNNKIIDGNGSDGLHYHAGKLFTGICGDTEYYNGKDVKLYKYVDKTVDGLHYHYDELFTGYCKGKDYENGKEVIHYNIVDGNDKNGRHVHNDEYFTGICGGVEYNNGYIVEEVKEYNITLHFIYDNQKLTDDVILKGYTSGQKKYDVFDELRKYNNLTVDGQTYICFKFSGELLYTNKEAKDQELTYYYDKPYYQDDYKIFVGEWTLIGGYGETIIFKENNTFGSGICLGTGYGGNCYFDKDHNLCLVYREAIDSYMCERYESKFENEQLVLKNNRYVKFDTLYNRNNNNKDIYDAIKGRWICNDETLDFFCESADFSGGIYFVDINDNFDDQAYWSYADGKMQFGITKDGSVQIYDCLLEDNKLTLINGSISKVYTKEVK